MWEPVDPSDTGTLHPTHPQPPRSFHMSHRAVILHSPLGHPTLSQGHPTPTTQVTLHPLQPPSPQASYSVTGPRRVICPAAQLD